MRSSPPLLPFVYDDGGAFFGGAVVNPFAGSAFSLAVSTSLSNGLAAVPFAPKGSVETSASNSKHGKGMGGSDLFLPENLILDSI